MRESWTVPVVLACSGGVDSTAMLLLASAARAVNAVPPFVVAHIDHRTRPESSAEADLVAGLCVEIRAPFVRREIHQPMRSKDEGTLRTARYDALSSLAHSLGLSAVVTAHTADDQHETVLMRLFTGASGVALAGMQPDQSLTTDSGPLRVLRPLLGVSHAELQDVLRISGVRAALDPSNQDRRYRRNAIRHDVIPAIESVFPGFREPLLRTAELASRDASALDDLASELYGSIAHSVGESVHVNRVALRALAPAVATRVVRQAAASIARSHDLRELSFERIEAVRLASSGRSGAIIELPYGVIACVTREDVVFESRDRESDGTG